MRSLLLLVIVISFQTHATRVIEATALISDLANELGFEVIRTKDKSGLTIELKGPSKLLNSCKPLATGHFIIVNNNEIAAFVSSANPSAPKSTSFIASISNHELVTFIDYQCENTAKRYTVSSND